MSRSNLHSQPALDAYLDGLVSEHPTLRELREVTAPMALAMMQIGASQGAFLQWLVRLLGARRTIEVGVFTGYSSLATALALPDDGRILACDVNEEWTTLARDYWVKAGVAHKVELVLAPARETLEARVSAGESNSYDFAFIDADKVGYHDYFEACVRLVRPGGVLVFDNVLWGGSVADSTRQSESTRALRRLNERVSQDRRVDVSIVPVGDGLLLARKL